MREHDGTYSCRYRGVSELVSSKTTGTFLNHFFCMYRTVRLLTDIAGLQPDHLGLRLVLQCRLQSVGSFLRLLKLAAVQGAGRAAVGQSRHNQLVWHGGGRKAGSKTSTRREEIFNRFSFRANARGVKRKRKLTIASEGKRCVALQILFSDCDPFCVRNKEALLVCKD